MWSDLATIFKESPNCSSRNGRKISRITVHHTAGKVTAVGLLQQFADPNRRASANYCIGNDGTIGGCVPEEMRAWTSGSYDNDSRAITIEVSNDVNGEPWSIGAKAYKATVELCVDICLRYGIKLWWNPENKTGSLTCHRWYQATACPGDWFYNKIPEFIYEVNNKVNEILDRITKLENAVIALNAQTQLNTTEIADLDKHAMPKYDSVKECPKWAKPTIQKLVKNGYLKGDENGNLMLTEDLTRTLVIVDRAGGFDD